ncbi:SpdD protein [Streptomyces sp. NPDC004014]
MFTPKYAPQDIAPAPTLTPLQTTAPVPAVQVSTPAAPPAPTSNRPTVQLTPGSALALAAGGGAVVLVVGTVLVSMLLAVAITAVSVAVTAVVLRFLITDLRKGH